MPSSDRAGADPAGAEQETWVPVGRVGRPHGVRGAFVVEAASEVPDRFARGATVRAGGEDSKVVESKRAGGRLVVRLDRTVERGTLLQVARSTLPTLEPGAYYVFELVGLAVGDEVGSELGAVTDVEPGLAHDVLVLDGGSRLPLVEDCVLDVDLERRRILVAGGFAAPG